MKRYRLKAWQDWKDEWFADVSKPKLRRILAREVAPEILAKGFDGLFLDNVDMIETRKHRDQRAGMRRLVRRLAGLVHGDGGLFFAQNGYWGLRKFGILEFLDGWNREDVTWGFDFDRRRYVRHPDRQVEVALHELARMRALGMFMTATDYTREAGGAAEAEAIPNACSVRVAVHVEHRPQRGQAAEPTVGLPVGARTIGYVERSQNGRADANGEVGLRNPRARQRALAIGALRETPLEGEDPLAELKELLRTAGVATAGELVQVRNEPDPDRYLGRGKLAELKAQIKRSGANLVACDDELAPRQERNLEAALDMPVIDRTAVILDIFADHAHTAEGKLQVELAQLEYNLARMRGLWTHLERLGAGRMDGGIGTRGPGESQIETDRRLARDRITALRRKLQHIERGRETMRERREASAVPRRARRVHERGQVDAPERPHGGRGERGLGLFHTLDPTTRAYEHDGRRYLVTDTVGFIRKLPHQLVEAFKATLEETRLADLIVHVVDASEPEDSARLDRRGREVLDEIDAGDRPRLLVFNKIDLLDEEERRRVLVGRRDAVGISAETGEGLDELRERIAIEFERTLEPMELLVPYARAHA